MLGHHKLKRKQMVYFRNPNRTINFELGPLDQHKKKAATLIFFMFSSFEWLRVNATLQKYSQPTAKLTTFRMYLNEDALHFPLDTSCRP